MVTHQQYGAHPIAGRRVENGCVRSVFQRIQGDHPVRLDPRSARAVFPQAQPLLTAKIGRGEEGYLGAVVKGAGRERTRRDRRLIAG